MAPNRIKHLSSIANQVIQTSALRIGSSVEELVDGFEAFVWNKYHQQYNNNNNNNNNNKYGRQLVEYCSSKGLKDYFCQSVLEEKISDGSFTRFTFDLMLAWESPTSRHHHHHFSTENVAKEKEDKKMFTKEAVENDDIPLFYSDIMPLLVTDEPGIGEDAFVWLGTLVPLITDVVNARFAFETLTESTNYRLYFPAYDKFLREIDKSMQHLARQAPPKGMELLDDEFILHVDGTSSSQRVVRHIGETSWPGRLTLTNYALYFEASGVITYNDAIKIDLSKHDDPGSQSVKPTATGPFGAPLYDKAIVYESSNLPEGIVLEFPEITSSTRRDRWLTLTTEILLLHKYLSTFHITCPIQASEMHARTILGVVRLHVAREMMRISSPDPKKFLIFALLDEIPKGDRVLEKLAESLEGVNCGHPCSASSILRRMNVREPIISKCNEKESLRGVMEDGSALESAIVRAREEEKEITAAKATAEELKQEGIANSAMVLIGLLMPLKRVFTWFQGIVRWERPASTLVVIMTALIVVYWEWVGKAIAVLLMWIVVMMICARQKRLRDECSEIVVSRRWSSDQSTMENVVSAQHGLRKVYETVQIINMSILKLWSIFISKAPKHADMVMVGLSGVAVFVALIPTKYIVMSIILYCFTLTSKLGRNLETTQDNRRLREWWDSIPVIPVRIVNGQ